MRRSVLAAAASGFNAPSAAAEVDGPANDIHVELSPATFGQQRQLIRQDLRGEGYREISAGNARRVREALRRMEHHLVGVSTVESLDPGDQPRVCVDQYLVNTLLIRAAWDSRMICGRETKVGRHFRYDVYMSAAGPHRAQPCKGYGAAYHGSSGYRRVTEVWSTAQAGVHSGGAGVRVRFLRADAALGTKVVD